MLLSLLLGKNIVAQNTVVGSVDGICWQKMNCVLLQSDRCVFGATKMKVTDVVALQDLQAKEQLPTLHLGKHVYNTLGLFVGQVQDVELSSTLKLKNLTLTNGTTVPLSQIIANNDIITIKAHLPKKAKRKPALLQERATQNGTSNQTTNGQVDVAHQQSIAQTALAPKRKSGDFSFLVGKVVDKNICNFWGELIIKKGEVVTKRCYLKARAFGKLTELCLHIK